MTRISAIAMVVGLFATVAVLRWHEGFSNVDDYLYAAQTQAYLDALPAPGGLLDAWRANGSNAPLVPTLALPLAALGDSPHWLVLVQIVPLLLLVVAARSLLGSLGLRPRSAWLAAGGIGASAPVLGYAAMYHFGLAATALTVTALAAYARSDRLARRRAAVLFGLALGLLSLTRVVAPVYVIAIVIPVAIDVLRSRAPGRLGNLLLSAGIATAVALPWWAVCGGTAWEYLTSAGYGDSPFTRSASAAEVVRERFDWTADETGWLVIVVIVVLLVPAMIRLRRDDGARRLLACLLAVCAVGMVFLATSSNAGTAFALPLVVLAACVAASGLPLLGPRARAAAIAACAAAVALPTLALLRVMPEVSVAGQPLWSKGIPAWQQARVALACADCPIPDSDELTEDVVDVVGSRPTLIVRADALLHPNGLRRHGATIAAPTVPGVVSAADLAAHRFVITGSTPAPYLPPANPFALDRLLRRAGFRPVLLRSLAPENTIAVWARSS